MKTVSIHEVEHTLARALSDLLGREYIVTIRDVEFKSDGAWIQLDTTPDMTHAFMKSLFENGS